MKLSPFDSTKEIRQQAAAMIEQSDALDKMMELDIPGRFVFAPPLKSRLVVTSLDELHAARIILRKQFGWEDRINNKFFSCGDVIVTYRPTEKVLLPLPFELWVEAPPEEFPVNLLGDCKLERIDRPEYSVVCPVKQVAA